MTVSANLLLKRLHQHRDWVNSNLLSVAESLSAEQLRQPFAIGQGSVWKSLLHLFAAEYVWLAALTKEDRTVAPGDGPDLPKNQAGPDPIADLADLKRRWSELAIRWKVYLATLPPESLEDLVTRVNSLTGKPAVTRRLDILLHVCTHAHYTAAQVVNMLRQIGAAKLPDTMLITLARGELNP